MKKKILSVLLTVSMLVGDAQLTGTAVYADAVVQTADQQVEESDGTAQQEAAGAEIIEPEDVRPDEASDEIVTEDQTGTTATINIGDIKYSLDDTDHTAYVYGYQGTSQTIVVPETVQEESVTYTVTAIGKSAFANKSIISVEIPQTVKTVGENAFYNCKSLKTFNWKSGDRTPQGQTMGHQAFCYCSKLDSIVLPEQLTDIGRFALFGCNSLAKFTIPASVTKIQSYAFKMCPGLKKVNWEEGTTAVTMEEGVFEFDTALTSITIPGKCNAVGRYAFRGCSKLKTVNYNASSINASTSIKYFAFAECPKLTKVTLPESLKTIENSAFQADVALKTVTLPSALTEIGRYAFYGCEKLTSMELPASVTKIMSHAFASCTALKTVKWNGSTEQGTMEDGIFYGCKALTAIVIPKNYTAVGEGTFENCSSLSDVCLSEETKSIGADAFKNCKKVSLRSSSKATVVKDYAAANKLKFVNKIGAITKVSVALSGQKNAKITWSKVSSAKNYTVYQKSSKGYKQIKSTTGTSLTVSAQGASKTYVIRANGEFYGKTVRSKYSSAVKAGASLKTPASLKATAVKKNSMTLKWGKVKNASGYYIYVKNKKDWKKVADVKKGSTTSAAVKSLKAGKKYEFCVQAYYKGKNQVGYSKMSLKITKSTTK